jgi:hypothetical protein
MFSILRFHPLTLSPSHPLLLLLLCLVLSACSDPERERIRATSRGKYDKQTGRLTEITFDKNKNGRVDTWVAMDGARALSARIDTDEDGAIDRWEEYDAEGRLVKAGESREKNGKPDLWVFMAPDGTPEHIEMIEVSDVTNVEGVVRREFYQAGARVRAEEDTDGDGVMDRWERYAGGVLTTVEFDDGRKRDGTPTQRFTYDGRGGLMSIESEPDGRGGYGKKVALGAGR